MERSLAEPLSSPSPRVHLQDGAFDGTRPRNGRDPTLDQTEQPLLQTSLAGLLGFYIQRKRSVSGIVFTAKNGRTAMQRLLGNVRETGLLQIDTKQLEVPCCLMAGSAVLRVDLGVEPR